MILAFIRTIWQISYYQATQDLIHLVQKELSRTLKFEEVLFKLAVKPASLPTFGLSRFCRRKRREFLQGSRCVAWCCLVAVASALSWPDCAARFAATPTDLSRSLRSAFTSPEVRRRPTFAGGRHTRGCSVAVRTYATAL